jgi:hypothetical protein
MLVLAQSVCLLYHCLLQHIMLHMPLVVQKANNETFLFHLAIMNKVSKFEGINNEALNMTLK